MTPIAKTKARRMTRVVTSPSQKKTEVTLDGVPEWFIGPLIAELVAHEVGHTLGLRHNFKASSIHTLEQINSDKIKGKETLAGSVMDYLPINMHKGVGEKQGDHTMTGIGPYDHWAIEYGYSIISKPEELQKILSRVSDPKLQFATDEDTIGPDPFARRYDFASNPLQYAHNQMNIVKHHRGQLLDHFVKKGQSWAKARYGYQLTLSLQSRSLSMMGNWIGLEAKSYRRANGSGPIVSSSVANCSLGSDTRLRIFCNSSGLLMME